MSSRTSGVAVAVNAAMGGRRAAVDPAALARRIAEPAVVGPEVVAPLRHAVRFVHDEARNGQLAQHAAEEVGREALGRDVEQAQLPQPRRAQHVAARVARELRVERRRPDAAAIELVDLILHQRDERRHDERDAGQQERRAAESRATCPSRSA